MFVKVSAAPSSGGIVSKTFRRAVLTLISLQYSSCRCFTLSSLTCVFSTLPLTHLIPRLRKQRLVGPNKQKHSNWLCVSVFQQLVSSWHRKRFEDLISSQVKAALAVVFFTSTSHGGPSQEPALTFSCGRCWAGAACHGSLHRLVHVVMNS